MKDLFNQTEKLPKEVITIIDDFNNSIDNYHTCKALIKKLNEVGYTCEYGLDAIPYNLRKVN